MHEGLSVSVTVNAHVGCSQQRYTQGMLEIPAVVKALPPGPTDSPELLFQTQLSHKVGSIRISLGETALWTGASTH